jgi:hypothetical protein
MHEVSRSHAPQSVGLLWTSDQLVAETSTWQHTQQTDIHDHGGIQTHNLSRRAAADPRLRPRGHRPQIHNVNSNSQNSKGQYSLFSKKNPFIRIFCISGWLALPINLHKWSSNICVIINQGGLDSTVKRRSEVIYLGHHLLHPVDSLLWSLCDLLIE